MQLDEKGGFMPTDWFHAKKDLLLQYRDETKRQLQFIVDEDPEGFLQSVEACEQMINKMNLLDEQAIPISDAEHPELKHILADIMAVREQISGMTPALYSKLKKGAAAEQRSAQINRAYSNENYHIPSIFYDKRK